MVNPKLFTDNLISNEIEFFCGVPDSLLKNFCAYVTDNVEKNNHIITVNEGSAIALGTGYYLATKKIPVIYMQNSGQGNTINPLTSLTDKLVYSIPQLLIIGWRGEPGVKDEPQHIKQGKVTIELLKTLGIEYEILSSDESKIKEQISNAKKYMIENKSPFALIVKKGTFDNYELKNKTKNNFSLIREQALEILLNKLTNENSVFISTTGKTSREVFELREKYKLGHEKDFLTVGCMGHASQIALGISLNSNKNVYCIDGDGAFLMHMGSISTIGEKKPKNFKHVILNNGAHESVGGQPTTGFEIDFNNIAKACGYEKTFSVSTKQELNDILNEFDSVKGPALLEIKISLGSRKDLGRPTKTPIENKIDLMNYLQK